MRASFLRAFGLALAGLALAPIAIRATGGEAGELAAMGPSAPSGARGERCRTGADVSSVGAMPRVSRVSRIVVIVMENKECGEIVRNPEAPYLNSLGRRYAVAVNSHGIRHPSAPNYLALTGGSTFGHASDCRYCLVDATSLVDQLERAGISWKAYMEDLPARCYLGGSSGSGVHRYVKELNPFLSYVNVFASPRCLRVVPLSDLAADLAAHSLPRFVWITPNICHSTHSCSIRDGDAFLARVIPPLLRALEPDGLLFLTWDEGAEHSHRGCCTFARGGNVATFVAGGAARRGAVSAVPYDHYSVLRTIEEVWHLPLLGRAACACTRPMFDLVARPAQGATRVRSAR